jgi:UDP-GlcNAc:undecaprenyl-phosphate GlcNAc-1-phosphate transferase
MSWFYIFIVPLIIAVCATPLVKKLAYWVGAVDQPNERKVHTRIMPRLGGVAIFIATTSGIIIFTNESFFPMYWMLLGSLVIVAVGILDDIKPLSAKTKLLGQIIAALIVVYGGIRIEFINVPLSDEVIHFGQWTWLISILWIVGITNALNLIDGLDGLAAGVSSIALATIFVMSLMMGNFPVATISLILLGSSLGFLVFNFYPAKIFMGDSGSLYLGFFLATLSLLGFKNITLISYVLPILILGVPIFDTMFAIIRRYRSGKSITAPDKGHLHHCLITMGFSHRKTVLIIYGITMVFSMAALFLSNTSIWIGLFIMLGLILFVLLGIEWTGVMGKTTKPITRLLIGFRSWVLDSPSHDHQIKG